MKSFTLLFILLFSIISCQKQEKFIDNTQNLDYEEFQFHLIDKKLSPDEICNNEKLRAKNDIKKGNLTFFYLYDSNHHNSFSTDLNSILGKFNIKNEEYLSEGCLKNMSDDNCDYIYPKLMDDTLLDKYGEKFKDSIISKAYSIFHQKNEDYLHDFYDYPAVAMFVMDKEYQDFQSNKKAEFEKNFKYPKDFIFSKKISQLHTTQAKFIVSKNGEIKLLKVKASFENKKNDKHKAYFENSVKSFLSNIKWMPIKCMNDNVDCIAYFSLYYKIKD